MNRGGKTSDAEIETRAADWIVRLDAGVTDAEQRAFEAWKAADPRHAAAVAHHEETWGKLERPRHAGHGDILVRRLRARSARRSRQRLAVVSACAMVLVAFGFLRRESAEPPAPGVAVAPAAPVAAAVIGPEKRTLPDGSTVELRAGSDLAVEYSAGLRRVVLRKGEAHFDVVPNVARPFVVVANGVAVRAVGTAFSVQLGASEVEVLVTEGRVAVEKSSAAATDENAAALAHLDAGKRIVVDVTTQAPRAGLTEEISARELDARLSWRAPRLDFSDTPLADALALMHAHAGPKQTVRFVIADPALNDIRLSGIFRADNADTFVRILEASFGVRAKKTGQTITLQRAR